MVTELKSDKSTINAVVLPKTIYLKDAPSYDLENEYVKMLYNWGEIYRYIKNNYR